MAERWISEKEIQERYETLFHEAEASGYHLNPDIEFTKDLVKGILVNEKRYGYPTCPCRMASGVKKDDLDIICPCDYRDPDLAEYDACYCALYVSGDILAGKKEAVPIPERRPSAEKRKQVKERKLQGMEYSTTIPIPVWRCKVCGYLCARDNPPETCPICKAGKERFERFL